MYTFVSGTNDVCRLLNKSQFLRITCFTNDELASTGSNSMYVTNTYNCYDIAFPTVKSYDHVSFLFTKTEVAYSNEEILN